jgi:Protein of unknown function (DUF2550)
VTVGGTTLVGILLLIACCFLAYLIVRRVRLMRGGGVDVCLRRRPASVTKDASAGWHFGVGRYRGNELVWYRLTSLRPGPSTVLDRMDLEILDRRPLVEAEVYALPQADSVLHCRSGGTDLEIAMAPGVLTGFLSWLEAAPPDRNPGYHQVS